MRKRLQALGAFAWSEREELTALLGLGLVVVGLWMVWRPAAFLVSGGILLWISLPSRRPFLLRADPPAPDARSRARTP